MSNTHAVPFSISDRCPGGTDGVRPVKGDPCGTFQVSILRQALVFHPVMV